MMQRRAVKLRTNFCSDKKKAQVSRHEGTYLVYLTIRGEAVWRSETDSNGRTSEGLKCAKKQQRMRPRFFFKEKKSTLDKNVSFHFQFPRSDCLG